MWKKSKEDLQPTLESRVAEAMFRQSPDAMLLLSQGRFVECNAAAERVYDRPRSAIIGRDPGAFSAPTQADGRPTAEQVKLRVAQALREGHARFEWWNLDRNDKVIRVMVTLIPAAVEASDDLLVIVQNQNHTMVVVDTLRDRLATLAKGDLTCRIDSAFAPDYEPLRHSFNAAIETLGSSFASVATAADRMSIGVEEISKAADDLSRRTEQQAASLEETAAALQEITSTVRETAAGSAKAAEVASEARADAADSSDVVRRAIDAMGGIERTSNEISDIIAVIDGISFQTNLLALNAGVEAARAGDAGKGFAVVASEVRALAQRSADAAKDIKSRIGASAEQVRSGVEHVNAAGSALDRIARQVTEMGALIADIADASRQQASGLGQINTAMSELDIVTQQNAAMVEEATAAARSLAGEAADMTLQVGRFRHQGGSTSGQSGTTRMTGWRAA